MIHMFTVLKNGDFSFSVALELIIVVCEELYVSGLPFISLREKIQMRVNF